MFSLCTVTVHGVDDCIPERSCISHYCCSVMLTTSILSNLNWLKARFILKGAVLVIARRDRPTLTRLLFACLAVVSRILTSTHLHVFLLLWSPTSTHLHGCLLLSSLRLTCTATQVQFSSVSTNPHVQHATKA